MKVTDDDDDDDGDDGDGDLLKIIWLWYMMVPRMIKPGTQAAFLFSLRNSTLTRTHHVIAPSKAPGKGSKNKL